MVVHDLIGECHQVVVSSSGLRSIAATALTYAKSTTLLHRMLGNFQPSGSHTSYRKIY